MDTSNSKCDCVEQKLTTAKDAVVEAAKATYLAHLDVSKRGALAVTEAQRAQHAEFAAVAALLKVENETTGMGTRLESGTNQ